MANNGVRQPKLFYVSSSTTTTTVKTVTFCYHVLSTSVGTGGLDPTHCGGKKKKRSIVNLIGENDEEEIVASKVSGLSDYEEREKISETQVMEGEEREAKFLNYWLTRTITNTLLDFTATSKVGSIACTPAGWSMLSCLVG